MHVLYVEPEETFPAIQNTGVLNAEARNTGVLHLHKPFIGKIGTCIPKGGRNTGFHEKTFIFISLKQFFFFCLGKSLESTTESCKKLYKLTKKLRNMLCVVECGGRL